MVEEAAAGIEEAEEGEEDEAGKAKKLEVIYDRFVVLLQNESFFALLISEQVHRASNKHQISDILVTSPIDTVGKTTICWTASA